MYPTVTLLVTKSSTFFFMIGFSVLFQECSNHIWKCPLPTVDQKLSNSNQGQETQLEEYVLRIHINNGSQPKLFIAKRQLVSHLKTISEHLLIWISQFALFDKNPSTSNNTPIKASLALALPTWGSLSIFSSPLSMLSVRSEPLLFLLC